MGRELEIAQEVARAAGSVLRANFGGPHQIEHKGPINIVTETDHQAEVLIRDRLTRAFPDYAYLGEESGTGGRPGQPRWIVDPLDGTTNYAHGYPMFCVSIGLEERGVPTVGVVYNPILDEMFTAQKGEGAWLNGRRLRVTRTAELGQGLLASGFPYNVWDSPNDNGRQWQRAIKSVFSMRSDGSAALDLCHVAAGRLDGFWELFLEPWDVAAGMLMVEEAGGRVTGLDGGSVDLVGGACVATNGLLHEELLALLNPEIAPTSKYRT